MRDDLVDSAVARLRPELQEAEHLGADSPAARELRERITEPPQMSEAKRPVRRGPVAAVLALAAAVAALVLLTPSDAGPLAPAEASVLSVKAQDGYYEVEVLITDGAPEQYVEAFAEQGIDAVISYLPASPDLVGHVMHMDLDGGLWVPQGVHYNLETGLTALNLPICDPEGCYHRLFLPHGHAETVEIVFGREAEVGEQEYEYVDETGLPVLPDS